MILDGEYSDWTGLTKDVPQASIPGPMLLLLFVNDLSDVVEDCTVNLYADDTTIYSTDENPVVFGARLKKDLERVSPIKNCMLSITVMLRGWAIM